MKSAISKNSKNSNSNASKAFFSKNGASSFFSQSAEVEKPFFTPTIIQPKLTIGQTGDKYEQEADSLADEVMQKLEAKQALPADVGIDTEGNSVLGNNNHLIDSANIGNPSKASHINLQKSEKENKEILELEEDPKQEIKELETIPLSSPIDSSSNNDRNQFGNNPLQSAPILGINSFPKAGIQLKEDHNSINAPSGIESKLSSSTGQGNGLAESALDSMESAFNTDLSDVRLHTGQDAVEMNRELGAQAFTHGQNIYFNEGKYKPETKSGKHLLAHELTHTIQQRGTLQKKGIASARTISKTNRKSIQALPALTGINVATEIGVGKNIIAVATLAPGTSRRTALTWSLVGAPAGVTFATIGRKIRISANTASLVSAGATFQVQCNLTGTLGDTFTSPNINLVGVTGVTFTAAPAFANQMAWGTVPQVFPPNTADPNRDGVAGNAATVNIVTAPVGRATTVTLQRRRGATVAGNIITPGTKTGTASVRVTDDATRTRNDQNLIINPVPFNLRRFTAQAPSGPYGAFNLIAWTSSDRTGVLNRVIGETITAGSRDDFGYTANINAGNGGPNPAPLAALAAPANFWNDNLFTPVGPVAGAAGDANMINLNMYVGPGVAARLPRIWILRQGFHWQDWSGNWSTEFDHGTHRRSLRKRGAGYGFRTEHRFPRAKARVWNEPYAGPPLINLTNITVTPAVPLADGGLAADGAATANVNVTSSVPARLIDWSVLKGTPVFTAGAAAGPVGTAATLQASIKPGTFRLRAQDSVFPNRRVDRSFRLRPVRLRRLRPVLRSVPAGTLSTIVSLTADPGGRTINWTVDAAAAAAGVTVVPVVNPLNLAARSATVTRPAVFTGRVTVDAVDSVIAARTAATKITFR